MDEGKPGRPKLGYRTVAANTSIVMEVAPFSSPSFAGPYVNCKGACFSRVLHGRRWTRCQRTRPALEMCCLRLAC